MSGFPIAVALVHHPVRDRRGDIITTAVTNLDLHDIARTCRTYDVGCFFVVTPVEEQQRLVQRMLDHWCRGHGASYNPDRRAALELIEVVDDLDAARRAWSASCGAETQTVLTAAGRREAVSFQHCRAMGAERPLLLVLGTGSGLAPGLFEMGWPVLEPIRGAGDYNHLSVRAAAAIMLDRLLGVTEEETTEKQKTERL